MSSTLAIFAKRQILIIDNHPLVRRGLIDLINSEPDLIVCAETATHAEALAALARTRADLIIMDLSLETVDDGLTLLKYIRSKYAYLLVLVQTMHTLPCYANLALQAGANGYITKREPTETLLIAIRCVLEGKPYVRPRVSSAGQEIH